MQKGIWFFKAEIQKNVPPVKFTKCELVQFCVKVTIPFFLKEKASKIKHSLMI